LKLKEVFESLDAFERPMAAASLGQVYKARLKQKGTPGNSDEDYFSAQRIHTYVRFYRPMSRIY
jgi:predicted unusual protein kinase regulating ubiquinone biosynthesis (AarF/ABC1/UbiB family)